MPYQIRHKATGIIMKMSSGKTVWAKQGHAKAALRTSGINWSQAQHLGIKQHRYSFDEQDIFELVETVEASSTEVATLKERLKRAEKLLIRVDYWNDDLLPSGLISDIENYVAEIKEVE